MGALRSCGSTASAPASCSSTPHELIALQQQDGSIPDDDARLPVTGGMMHTTYQAMQTWRQAFARTADDKWLAPMRKAGALPRAAIAASGTARATSIIQNINFALLGLVAAGVGPAEASSLRLQKMLLARQNQDGGWGLDRAKSDALATGQTLYALKLAGHTRRRMRAIARGTTLAGEQAGADGAWRTVRSGQGGAEKGEGMWAVLGLVVDRRHERRGQRPRDGQHVDADDGDRRRSARQPGAAAVSARSRSSSTTCRSRARARARLAWSWKTAALARGQARRRRRRDQHAAARRAAAASRCSRATSSSPRSARASTRRARSPRSPRATSRRPPMRPARSSCRSGRSRATDNKRKASACSRASSRARRALTAWTWDGARQRRQAAAARPLRRGAGDARRARQDAPEGEHAVLPRQRDASRSGSFAEIEGNLGDARRRRVSANTTVELSTRSGRSCSRCASTAQGNYRFKSVAGGKYKCARSKDGWDGAGGRGRSRARGGAGKANMSF